MTELHAGALRRLQSGKRAACRCTQAAADWCLCCMQVHSGGCKVVSELHAGALRRLQSGD